MQLAADQMAALAATRRAAFLDRVTAFIAERANRQPEPSVLSALFDRALQYGLTSERQCAGYITLAWASGARPPAADPRWIAQVMDDPSREGDDRIEALYAAADARSAERA